MYSPNIKNFLNIFQVDLISTKSLCSESKNKKDMKQKSIRKNRHFRKSKTLKNKKQVDQVQTKQSLQFDAENHQKTFRYISSKQYKEQVNQLKKFLIETHQGFNFQFQDFRKQQEIIQEIINFVPISIDQLFDQYQTSLFKKSFDFNDLLGYFKLLYKSQKQNPRKIFLSCQGQMLYLTKQVDRQENHHLFKGTFIQKLQQQVYQNRPDFMEKIRINQSKYQSSGSYLTQISQELLFLSKVYMENSSKLKKLVENLRIQKSDKLYTNLQQKSTEKIYYQILIFKNIRYAFSNQKINYLNYYFQKQNQENNFQHEIKANLHEDELKNYLKTKKSKKSKFPLPTACSCCFSAYFEAINPFLTCQGCSLRCHKLCFDLKQNICGNCSYQRISRLEKDKIQFCFICKQKGQMTMKVGLKSYAHAFCLLTHKLWKMGNFIQSDENSQKLQNKAFISSQINQLSNQRQKNYGFNQKPAIIYYDMQEIKQICCSSLIESQYKIQKCNSLENSLFKNQSEYCKICLKQFYGNLWISCNKCSKKYHTFCAFFEGFQLQIITKSQHKEFDTNFVLNCCQQLSEEKQDLKRKRSFTVNRNRYLFEDI